MDLGKSLKIALVRKGMRQNKLATEMGTSGQQVSRWIRSGAIHPSSLIEICSILDVKPSEFVALGE